MLPIEIFVKKVYSYFWSVKFSIFYWLFMILFLLVLLSPIFVLITGWQRGVTSPLWRLRNLFISHISFSSVAVASIQVGISIIRFVALVFFSGRICCCVVVLSNLWLPIYYRVFFIISPIMMLSQRGLLCQFVTISRFEFDMLIIFSMIFIILFGMSYHISIRRQKCWLT